MATNPCHKALVNVLQTQERQVSRIYGDYSRQLAEVLRGYSQKSGRDVWRNNLRIENKVDKILTELNSEMQRYILGNQEQGWSMSNLCTDKGVEKYLKGITDVRQAPQFFSRNLDALKAFQTRKIDGLGLSSRVWKITEQTKEQVEQLLSSGIMEGRSAAKMARDLQGYLTEPERRYRRIRDASGKLVYSSPGADYHPGQGTARSSYQNALRLSRNETNIAYRQADNVRRQQLDFVTGIQVNLSNAHVVVDICDELQGRYPKTFVFTGWHPNCICFTTNVLLSQKEFQQYVNGGQIRQQRYIRTIPKRAENYLNERADRIKGWKNKPYFLRDNFKNTKEGFALKQFVTEI